MEAVASPVFLCKLQVLPFYGGMALPFAAAV